MTRATLPWQKSLECLHESKATKAVTINSTRRVVVDDDDDDDVIFSLYRAKLCS